MKINCLLAIHSSNVECNTRKTRTDNTRICRFNDAPIDRTTDREVRECVRETQREIESIWEKKKIECHRPTDRRNVAAFICCFRCQYAFRFQVLCNQCIVWLCDTAVVVCCALSMAISANGTRFTCTKIRNLLNSSHSPSIALADYCKQIENWKCAGHEDNFTWKIE